MGGELTVAETWRRWDVVRTIPGRWGARVYTILCAVAKRRTGKETAMLERRPLPSHTLLVRCWLDGHAASDGSLAWRYVVEEVGEERRRYTFTSLDALMAYLDEWLYQATR